MSTISANTFLAADGTPTTEPSIPALDQRMAKAWVNFNGTGAVAIRDSYNVSSVTDFAVGDYVINLAASMPNSNYAVFALGRNEGGYGGKANIRFGSSLYSSSFRIEFNQISTPSAQDVAIATIIVFGS
jgi:hypothetical protein